jgi:hypothetical protein
MRRSTYFAKTIKHTSNFMNKRKTIKLLINGNNLKKRNSEFLSYGNLFKNDSIMVSPEKNIKLSVLDNKNFFRVSKIDPRLDE